MLPNKPNGWSDLKYVTAPLNQEHCSYHERFGWFDRRDLVNPERLTEGLRAIVAPNKTTTRELWGAAGTIVEAPNGTGYRLQFDEPQKAVGAVLKSLMVTKNDVI